MASASANNSPDEEKEVVVKAEVVNKEYDKAYGLVENTEDHEDQDKVNQDEDHDEYSDEEEDEEDQDNENSDAANINETENVDKAMDDNVKVQDDDKEDSDDEDDDDDDDDDDEDEEDQDINDKMEDQEDEYYIHTVIDAKNGASIDITPNGVIPRRKRKLRAEEHEDTPSPVKAIKRGSDFFLSFNGKEYPIKVEDADAIGIGSQDQDHEEEEEEDPEQEQSPVTHAPIPNRTERLLAKPPTHSAYSTYSTGPPNPLAALNPKDQVAPSEAQLVMTKLLDNLNGSKARSPIKEVEKVWFVAEMSTFEFNLLMKFFELYPKPMRSYYTATGGYTFQGPEVDSFLDKDKRLSSDVICKMFPVFHEDGDEPTFFIPIPRGSNMFTFTAEANPDNVGIEGGFYFDMWLSEYPPTPTTFDYSIPWLIPDDSKIPIGIPISPVFSAVTRSYTTRLFIFDEGDLGDGKNVAPFRCLSLGFGRQQGADAEAPKCSVSFSIQSLTPRTRFIE